MRTLERRLATRCRRKRKRFQASTTPLGGVPSRSTTCWTMCSRRSTVLATETDENSSGPATVSGTSTTTAYGCCSLSASTGAPSPGRLPPPPRSEDANHSKWRRADNHPLEPAVTLEREEPALEESSELLSPPPTPSTEERAGFVSFSEVEPQGRPAQ